MGNKLVSYIVLALILLQTLGALYQIYSNQFNAFVFIFSFLCGVQDSATNTHLSEILGFDFENNTEPFAIFNLVQSIAVFIFLAIEAFVKTKSQYYAYNLVFGLIGLTFLGFFTLTFEFNNQEKH